MSKQTFHGLHLFSSGLDSIVSAKVLQAQGLRMLCLHLCTPFFGKPEQVPLWTARYNLNIEAVDISGPYIEMLRQRPRHGFGKHLNPCIDCKILMLSLVKDFLPKYQASFISSGEVLGQRPMSQRRDAMNIVSRDSGTRELLLRPLCALKLPPTPMELSGLVKREGLYGITGRGRKGQLELAASFGIKDPPSPAGGCLLTEMESARRYWPLLARLKLSVADDFRLANVGRQYWSEAIWLTVGRDQSDNEAIAALKRPDDFLFRLADFPGPLALGRGKGWNGERLHAAAAVTAWFSPKARAAGGEVVVEIQAPQEELKLMARPHLPPEALGWLDPTWDEAALELKSGRSS